MITAVEKFKCDECGAVVVVDVVKPCATSITPNILPDGWLEMTTRKFGVVSHHQFCKPRCASIFTSPSMVEDIP